MAPAEPGCAMLIIQIDSQGLYDWQLTHLCRMDFPILINWTNTFPFKELLGSIFHFYSNK